jgi:2-polyprenyl-3-methyl-5-hydroxy-6-metoxy-1,4-benzoquinol methylase
VKQDSKNYWTHCLYEARDFFDTDNSEEALNADIHKLRSYAITAFERRRNSPYGDYYHKELDELTLGRKEVLEFGCGVGIDAFHMALRGARVSACDIVPTNVKIVDRLLRPFGSSGFLLDSYDQLDNIRPFDSFDLVYAHGVLHHIQPEYIDVVTSKLAGRVKPGGHALVMVYTKTFYPVENTHKEGPYARGYSNTELANMFADKLTLQSSRIFMNGNFQWGLFKKP